MLIKYLLSYYITNILCIFIYGLANFGLILFQTIDKLLKIYIYLDYFENLLNVVRFLSQLFKSFYIFNFI